MMGAKQTLTEFLNCTRLNQVYVGIRAVSTNHFVLANHGYEQ
jgi:hypothetical protein